MIPVGEFGVLQLQLVIMGAEEKWDYHMNKAEWENIK